MKADEVQKQDKRLMHLAKYDATLGWRLALSAERAKKVLPRFRQFKTMVMKNDMTIDELEEWIYRKNGDPDYSYDDLDDFLSPAGFR